MRERDGCKETLTNDTRLELIIAHCLHQKNLKKSAELAVILAKKGGMREGNVAKIVECWYCDHWVCILT